MFPGEFWDSDVPPDGANRLGRGADWLVRGKDRRVRHFVREDEAAESRFWNGGKASWGHGCWVGVWTENGGVGKQLQ